LPVDLVFLVDVSNSMTRGTPGGANDPSEPGDPGSPVVPGDPPKEPPPDPGPPGPVPPIEPLVFRANPDLAALVPWSNMLAQDPVPPDPGDPGPVKPPVPNPNDPGSGNPNAEPAGCGGNDAVNPGGGGNDVTPVPGGPNEPSPPREPPTPVPPVPDPGGPLPTRTPIDIGGPPGEVVDPRQSAEPAGSEDLIRDAQRFIRDFFDEAQIKEDLSDGALRVGMVSFNDRGRRLVSLTDQGKRAATRVSLLRGGGLTRIDIGLRTAERTLQDRNRRYGILQDNDRTKVIVVISDGGFCDRDLRARVAKEIQVVGLFAGRGAYQRRMRDIVTENEYLLDLNARGLKEFMFLYNKDFLRTEPVTMDKLEVVEQLRDNMELVPGSVSPGGVVDDKTIRWSFEPPTAAMTVSYEVKPLEEGYHLITDASDAVWTDNQARDGQQPFPDVRLSVNYDPPTATSTPVPPTNTPVPVPPTPTPEIEVLRPAYLPVAFRQEEKPKPTPVVCEPSRQKVDIALVIDTSISMSDITTPGGPTKIDAAVMAAKALVGQLKFASGDQDQATVIGFNSQATAFVPLTFDRNTVDAALDLLKANQAAGTRIDLGLAEARRILNGNGARDVATQTIVLVTDAKLDEVGAQQDVRDEAARVNGDGISLFTVGLGVGADIDEALLREIATRPEFYTHAPDASELEQIYLERIAPLVPCP
jgi:Mg-chelatase subunit ChlD